MNDAQRRLSLLYVLQVVLGVLLSVLPHISYVGGLISAIALLNSILIVAFAFAAKRARGVSIVVCIMSLAAAGYWVHVRLQFNDALRLFDSLS
jgi:hypothetical protein